MNWTIEKIFSPAMIRVTVRGRFDQARMREFMQDLAIESAKLPPLPILFDDREMTTDNLDTSKLAEISQLMFQGNDSLAGNRVAILMHSVDDFLRAWEFKAIAEPTSKSAINVFNDEEAAMEWLSH